MTETNQTAPEELSFRDAMRELDEIVRTLESNQLELEDSIVAYERGVALLKQLRAKIDAAQQKVDVLLGELDERDDALTDTTLQKA